jgi:hypothetical protein
MDESSFTCFDQAIRKLGETAFALGRLASIRPDDEGLRLYTNVTRLYATIERMQQIVMSADMGHNALSVSEKRSARECSRTQEEVAQRLHQVAELTPEHREELLKAACDIELVAANLSELSDDTGENLLSAG